MIPFSANTTDAASKSRSTSPEAARALLLSYLERANRLRDHPEWYNALTSNCTTNIRVQADEARGHRSPLDWRIILNGHSDEMLYERGRIATNLPFAELRQRCHINSRARAADKAVDFSGLIRQGVPARACTTGTARTPS